MPGVGRERLARQVLAAIAAVAFFCLLATPPASAAPQGLWVLPAGDLSAPSQTANSPEITTAPDGSVTAVWYRSNGIHYVVQAATRPQGGSFGVPVDLSAAGQSAVHPQITTAPDGSATAVWYRSNSVVQAVIRPPGGAVFGTPVDLSATGQQVNSPQITTAADGSATAVWSRNNGAHDIIQSATRPPGGAFFGTPVDLSAAGQNATDPQITTAPDGSATAVWYRSNGSYDFIQASTRPPGGSFGAPVDLSAPGQSAANPQVTTAPDGAITVVWTRSNGSNVIIQAATRPPGGSFAAPVDLSAPGQDAADPQVTAAPDGSATAVWYRINGFNSIIQASTRPSGGSFGAPVDLSAAGQNAARPQITAAPDGSATAVWYRSNGGHLIIQSSTRAPGGPFVGPVNLSASGRNALEPQITTAPDGSATAIWTRDNGSNSILQSVSTAQPSPLLQINRPGSGTGTVTSSPGGIDCGTNCAEIYLSFTAVTLTATPAIGSTFEGWGGACEDSVGDTCELTLLEDQNISADFESALPPPGEARLANLKITPKSKAAKPGKKITFRVRIKNTGDATAKNLKICTKGPKKLVKLPKCRKAGSLAAGKSKTAKVKVAVKRSAKKGRKAKVTFTATAAAGLKKTGEATIRVK